ncbi:hypothetical protein ATCM_03700 [Stenotrophomonas sp. ATCM1_4]|uniref:hypothetical protein n=1 Tax=Stenotrophomonas sp. ATCM1_4 TaxID=2259330 RepID=UPI001048F79F|nr:hypothetical protein [Stenotrophomonas sp. ATCM1_4]TDB26822.1 hypothetical protein ATCM_03700 [Stenotrophomonas sp. ATCM1_4]
MSTNPHASPLAAAMFEAFARNSGNSASDHFDRNAAEQWMQQALDECLPKPAAAQEAAVIEQIAQQWAGCMYDAPGETIDIGEAIRAAGKRIAPVAAAPGIYLVSDILSDLSMVAASWIVEAAGASADAQNHCAMQMLEAIERWTSKLPLIDASPKGGSDVDLREELNGFLEAQDALDNWETAGPNRDLYESVMARRNSARRDLDAALQATSAEVGS